MEKLHLSLVRLILCNKLNGDLLNVNFLENFDIAMKYLTKKVEYKGKTYMQIEKASGNFKITG